MSMFLRGENNKQVSEDECDSNEAIHSCRRFFYYKERTPSIEGRMRRGLWVENVIVGERPFGRSSDIRLSERVALDLLSGG